MVSFFLAIFSAGIGILVLWILIRAILRILAPMLRGQKGLKRLKHLISQSRYDRINIAGAVKNYVPPKCIERAPSKADVRKGRFGYNPQDLSETVQQFIQKDGACRHLLILADSGMGKTSFLLNFYSRSKKKYNTALIPLNLKKADDLIDKIPAKKDTVLLLDGLDEDINPGRLPFEHLIYILERTKAFKKIIMTCTESYIPPLKFSVRQGGYDIISPADKKKDQMYKIKRLFFSRMNMTRAEHILDRATPVWQARRKKKTLNFIQSNSTGVTPFTLKYLPQFLPEEPSLLSKTFLYKHIIKLWIEDQFNWTDKQQLYIFLKKLAGNIYLRRYSRREERIPQDELKSLSKEWGIEVKPFQKDEKALVSLTPSKHYRFTHRSILEFFFIQQLLSGDKACGKTELTHGMKDFLFESLVKDQDTKLGPERHWLTGVELKAHGLKHKSQDTGSTPPHLLKSLLIKNPNFGFLTRLPRLLSNPIFAEFGWDSELFKNLENAVHHSKSSFMRLEKKRWDILINSQQIEITKRARESMRISLTPKVYNEYASLADNERFTSFCASVGLTGLRIITNINRTGNLAIVPDMETHGKFTLFFWRRGSDEN